MARSKQDDLKRKIGQAVNHYSGAILDINDVYVLFRDAGKPEAENLKAIMIATNAMRDALLDFAQKAWLLDEDALMKYL